MPIEKWRKRRYNKKTVLGQPKKAHRDGRRGERLPCSEAREESPMSSRIFQSVVLQMKESTQRPVGVMDSDGTVIACSELTCIGEHWPGAAQAINGCEGGGPVVCNGRVFKALSGWSQQFGYAAFAGGEDPEAHLTCQMAAVALNGAKTYYEEKHDKGMFLKNVISDNIMPGEIDVRAKELHLAPEVPRAVFLVRQSGATATLVTEVVQGLCPDRQTEFVLPVNETNVALIKQLTDTESRDLHKIAHQIEDALVESAGVRAVIGIGTVAWHIRDLARSYKEAQVAIDVGKVFSTEDSIINYETLGIGRLIYQLPTTLCEMFLQEVFKKNPIDALDQETLFTINKFFENNLNVSETARKLFVHRNTLVYRLEKIKKLTGLDLREFDDAITFKVALMVKKYLVSRGVRH